MKLALLTTMNSKVKVHVVDGSKCVLDGSHDKEKPGSRQPTFLGSSGVLSGPLSKTKRGLDQGLRVQGVGRGAQRLRREGAGQPGG